MKSKKELKQEIFVGIGAIVASVIYFCMAFSIKQKGLMLTTSANSLTPDTVPKIIGLIGIIVGFAIMIPAIIKYKKEAANLPDVAEDEVKIPFMTKDRIVIIASMCAYLLLIEILGYIIATILLAVGLLTYLEKGNYKKNILFAVIFVVACFLIFNDVLQIWLPLGIFFE